MPHHDERAPCEAHRGPRDPKATRAADLPGALGEAAPPIIAIDIETTGLESDCTLTCVCTWDGRTGRTWFFRDVEEAERSHKEIAQSLAAAPLILAFNGAHFDLPVLARCLALDHNDDTLGAWMAKLVDPLYAARATLGLTQDLNSFLALNGLPTKSGSGAHAVELAREGRWADLGAYCMDDTRLTFDAIAARGVWDADRGIRFDPWHPHQIFIRQDSRA